MLIALIVLGPQRLPDAARQIGKAMARPPPAVDRLPERGPQRPRHRRRPQPGGRSAQRPRQGSLASRPADGARPSRRPTPCAPSRSWPARPGARTGREAGRAAAQARRPEVRARRPRRPRSPRPEGSAAKKATPRTAHRRRRPRRPRRRGRREARRRPPRPDEHQPPSPWSSTTAGCRSWSTSRSSATGIIKIVIAVAVGMVVAFFALRPHLRLPHRALQDIARRATTRSPTATLLADRSARGLRRPHEAVALRAASPSPCR